MMDGTELQLLCMHENLVLGQNEKYDGAAYFYGILLYKSALDCGTLLVEL